MNKRLLPALALLLLLTGASLAQTVTVAPDPRYSTAIVPAAVVLATLEGGQVFTFRPLLRGSAEVAGYKVRTHPTGQQLRTVQVWSNQWMFVVDVASLAGVTRKIIVGLGIPCSFAL